MLRVLLAFTNRIWNLFKLLEWKSRKNLNISLLTQTHIQKNARLIVLRSNIINSKLSQRVSINWAAVYLHGILPQGGGGKSSHWTLIKWRIKTRIKLWGRGGGGGSLATWLPTHPCPRQCRKIVFVRHTASSYFLKWRGGGIFHRTLGEPRT